MSEIIIRLIHGDCLEVMNRLSEGSVDLCYADPPFFTQGIRKIRKQGFKDKWKSLEEYIDWMRVRVERIYALLSSTSSFYLHCDWHASHYLKVMLDDVFGYDRFRREIVWNTVPLNASGFKTIANNWIHATSHLLYYVKTENFTFNKSKFELPEFVLKYFHTEGEDEFGKFRISKWRQKIYIEDASKAGYITNVWNDILGFDYSYMNLYRKESVGYPTQKPVKLLKRIVEASSNEGEVVLDPFCGSGTTGVACKKLGRHFVGIDDSLEAVRLSKRRLGKVGV